MCTKKVKEILRLHYFIQHNIEYEKLQSELLKLYNFDKNFDKRKLFKYFNNYVKLEYKLFTWDK